MKEFSTIVIALMFFQAREVGRGAEEVYKLGRDVGIDEESLS